MDTTVDTGTPYMYGSGIAGDLYMHMHMHMCPHMYVQVYIGYDEK